MNTQPAIPHTQTTPKMSVEAARLVLGQALKTAHKPAMNAPAGASFLMPPEVIVTAATAAPEHESGS